MTAKQIGSILECHSESLLVLKNKNGMFGNTGQSTFTKTLILQPVNIVTLLIKNYANDDNDEQGLCMFCYLMYSLEQMRL